MKIHFLKPKPRIITYRSYKKFDKKIFMGNLNVEIVTQSNYLEKTEVMKTDAYFKNKESLYHLYEKLNKTMFLITECKQNGRQ